MSNQSKLNKYVKLTVPKQATATTSVTLEQKHIDFVHAHRLNLSAITRDAVDVLMSEYASDTSGAASTPPKPQDGDTE